MKEYSKNLADVFKSLSNPKKISIILLLSNERELSVSDICEKIKCEQSLISHHLKDLKEKNILLNRKEGKNIYYSLKSDCFIKMINCLKEHG